MIDQVFLSFILDLLVDFLEVLVGLFVRAILVEDVSEGGLQLRLLYQADGKRRYGATKDKKPQEEADLENSKAVIASSNSLGNQTDCRQ